MKIQFNDLAAQWNDIKSEAQDELLHFLDSGWYIGGPLVDKFEEEFAQYIGVNYGIGVSNGTDALKLCIQVLDLEGNVEVIMPANGYIADPLSVWYQTSRSATYTMKLIDCNDQYQMDTVKLEEYLDTRYHEHAPTVYDHTIILPVHLYGHPVDMRHLMKLANKHNCYVIEDASQAHGATCNGKKVGTYGHLTAYSLYPGKNLGACGDAGIITTNIPEYAHKLKALRNYGSYKKYHHDHYGWNHRLDPLQSIILIKKLKMLDMWNTLRKKFARDYDELLADVEEVTVINNAEWAENVYHIYPIRVSAEHRDKLMEFLSNKNVPTIVHYPIPIQKTKIFEFLPYTDDNNPKTVKYADELISLPIHPYLKEEQIAHVVHSIKEYFNGTG